MPLTGPKPDSDVVDLDVAQVQLTNEQTAYEKARTISNVELEVTPNGFEKIWKRAQRPSEESVTREGENPLLEEHAQPWLDARTKMPLFLLAGATAGVGHHLFYAALDGRPAEGGIFASLRSTLHAAFSDQSLVNLFANVLSKVGAQCLAAVVGITFAQLFWARMIRKAARIRDIDSVVSLARNPLDFSSWAVTLSMRSLALVALAAALMQFIEVVAPGALTVAPISSDESCSYEMVDLDSPNSTSMVYSDTHWNLPFPTQATYSLTARILMAGTYIPPQRQCQSCEYNVTYLGPAVQCKNVTQTTNLTLLTSMDTLYPWSQIGVWAASTFFDPAVNTSEDSDYILSLQSRNILEYQDAAPRLNECPVVALHCTGWIAEYVVNVRHNITSTSTLLGTTMLRPFLYEYVAAPQSIVTPPPLVDIQIWGLWTAFFAMLSQNVTMQWMSAATGGTPGYDVGIQKPWLPWSVLGRGSNVLPWQWPWPRDLQVTVPGLMQNISLSLLAGAGAGVPKLTEKTTMCRTTTLRYVYYRARLLGTYGAMLAVASILLIIGYRTRMTSSRSETLDFSRTLAAYPLSERLIRDDSVVADANGVLHRCQPGFDE